jgi:ribosomal subunit interface protein
MKLDVAILHHEHYPEHVRSFVAKKLKHLGRFFDRTEAIHARVERQHADHRVELIASARRGVVLVVEARSPTLDEALDQAVDRMARVLRRHKEKLIRNGRRRTRKAS